MTRTGILYVVLWMTGTLLAFSVMAVSLRELSGSFSVFEILFFRYSFGLVLFGTIAVTSSGLKKGFATHRLGLHVIRNVVHFAGTYAWALGLTLLPLATVFALEFTTPAWVSLLAVLMLGERLTVSRGIAVFLGFVGVLVILRPGFDAFQPIALVVLAAAFAFGLALIATKSLTTTESTNTILLYMNLIQLPLTFIGADPTFLAKITPAMLPAIVSLGLAGVASHYCITNAFRSGDAMVVVPLDFLRLPLIAIVGAVLYQEKLDLFVFLGAIVIIFGILMNLKSEMRSPVRP